jgi:CDP-diacylglycerol---serine O-phosphatidyltransferase
MRTPKRARLPRPSRLNRLPFNKMIPNILTLLALCAGMTAIQYSLRENWEAAVYSILAAAILDTLDGRVARLLKGSSKFGAELDSLSDFIGFGVAPALMLFMWSTHDLGKPGWVVALLFGVCCALRLARFNTALESAMPPWAYNYFSGVPAPAGAGLVLTPMILSFLIGDEVVRQPEIVAGVLVVVSALLVSNIPTFSFKKFHISQRWVLPTMLIVLLLFAASVSAPWTTLSVVIFLYIGTIPFSIRAYSNLKKQANNIQGIAEEMDSSEKDKTATSSSKEDKSV